MTASRWTMILVAAAWSSSAQAIGLGPIELDSALGQPLRARISVFEAAPGDLAPACIKAKVESLEGAQVALPRVSVTTSGSRSVLMLASTESVNEPAVSVRVHLDCGSRVQRNYQLILDFPSSTIAEAVLPAIGSVQSIPLPDKSRISPRMETGLAGASRPNPVPTDGTIRRSIAALSKREEEPKINRAVLKLSTEEYVFTGAMKMADALSLPPSGQDTLPPSDQTRIARSQFAAILRGENPAVAAALEAEAANKKLHSAEIARVALVREKEAAQAAFEDLSGKSYSATWVAGLSGLLIFCLGTMGWLALRLKKAKNAPTEWWKTHNVVTDDLPAAAAAASGAFIPDAVPGNSALRAIYPFASDSPEKELAVAAIAESSYAVDAQPKPRADLPPLEIAPRTLHGFHDTMGTFHGDTARHLNVEEVSDIVQEAEFWMLLNDPERALHLLEPHAEVEKPDSPVTWLYLIDLYRQVGDREKYQALGQRFKKYFNARIPAWEEDLSNTEHTSLEDFPGLLDRITSAWSDKAVAVPFLESLLIDDRNGERVGFDLPVYKDIILLIGVANETARLRTA